MDFTLFKHDKHLRRLVPPVLLWITVLWIGFRGLSRGLWLDEVWVANSLRESSLAAMFWGGEWLQTSPPLFLLIARVVDGVRVVPLLFASVATIAMYLAARKIAPHWAALATATLMFPAVAIEYFTSFKQYGAEAATVALILWAAQFRWTILCTALLLLMPLAYPLAFLIPGLVLYVRTRDGLRPALTLALSSAAMLALLYVVFIQPNTAPSLWAYWATSHMTSWPMAAVAIAFCAWALWKRDWFLLACALPALLLGAAEFAGWYPASPRTRLFVRPCLILAAVILLRNIPIRYAAIPAIAWGLATAATYRPEPFEDYPAAISYLREHVQPGDMLLVHADAREGFRFYAPDLMRRATFGSTGWPCCSRAHEAAPNSSSEAAVRADLDRMVPRDFHGAVWLFYANRPLHWKYIGLDEGDLWRRHLWDRGCPPGKYIDLPNLVISPAICR